MTQKTRERLAIHYNKLGVNNPYIADFKDEAVIEIPEVKAEPEEEEKDYFKPKKSGKKNK
jgi:hypothetical protein